MVTAKPAGVSSPRRTSVSIVAAVGPANRPEQTTASRVMTMKIDRRLNWKGLGGVVMHPPFLRQFHVERPIAPALPVSCETSSVKAATGASSSRMNMECENQLPGNTQSGHAPKHCKAEPMEPVSTCPQTTKDRYQTHDTNKDSWRQPRNCAGEM